MSDALLGSSGFVGSTLKKQARFAAFFRSSNIAEADGKHFSSIVCCAAPGQKWLARKEPAIDRGNIELLITHLATLRCETFVLISTVDVFASPMGVDEDVAVQQTGLQAYGLHRRLLEVFVEQTFDRHLIVRLPGLVGPGLKKNIIFDLQNGNQVSAIDGRSSYQFYPMVNLWYDVQTALQAGLRLVHLTAEPISVDEVATLGFGRDPFDSIPEAPPVHYDLQSKYAALFHRAGRYQYSKSDTLLAIRAYAQSEPLTMKP